MAYADFDYYKNSFKGSIITDSTTFNSMSEKATDYINSATFGRINSVTDTVKRCCCALAETILYKSDLDSGKIVESEKNGSYSVTYAKNTNTNTSTDSAYQKKLKNICLQYLGNTGLMYRGAFYDN